MKFTSLVIGFQEENARREPYFMGFTFDGRKYVFKGEFLKPDMIRIGTEHSLGWGENEQYKCETLADLLLIDCLGEQAKSDLIQKLKESLLTFQKDNGIAWLIYADDLMKWINLPKYGIIPRIGYLATLEKGVLT